MKLKLLLKPLSFVAFLMFTLGANAYDFVSDNIYYNITGQNTVEVTYENETDFNSYSGTVVIPATVTYGNVDY